MPSVYLDAYIDNATYHLERFVPHLAARSLRWRDAQAMAAQYRQRGACALLLYGTPDRFYVNMMQSAGAFLFFLRGFPDEQKITSQAKPFFDALGGGYVDAARAIAESSRGTWNRDLEYEEEFLYVLLLMRLLFLPDSAAECAELLGRLEAKSTPGDATRLQVCRSLVDRDSEEFNGALAALLDERQDRVAGLIQRGAVSEEMASWLRHFAIEGLALVRLAERLGIVTEPNYLHIPDQVRPPSPYPFNPDAWRTVADTAADR